MNLTRLVLVSRPSAGAFRTSDAVLAFFRQPSLGAAFEAPTNELPDGYLQAIGYA